MTSIPTRTESHRAISNGGMRTLAIDIGGTGLKALLVGSDGTAITERVRVETPHPATPAAVLGALRTLVGPLGEFERVTIGFPGVIEDGVVRTAPNLHEDWEGFDLAQTVADALHRPVRVLNDAAMHGYAFIEGKGLEMVLTLGTGFGSAVYSDGHYVPNLELAHRPFRKGKTFEQYVGKKALKKLGKKRWNKRVRDVIEQALTWNPRKVYVGGGNSKHLRLELPQNVERVENVAGLLGAAAVWADH
jgi:polyphosphate glucokinase